MIFTKETIQKKECSITTIKYATKESDSHFFDRKTMKFFGQRMSDFKKKVINDRVFIYATSRLNFDGKRVSDICSIREVIVKGPDKLALKFCDNETKTLLKCFI